uniref:Uncharacterized protein n=1 Tax=Magnetococcus massalia (strain MO-1) TaxID=451514 RepID=A0A1S7LE76_MAGMO|nr:conserved protein of unknown function [Candidatus Magnetococcus massalia]
MEAFHAKQDYMLMTCCRSRRVMMALTGPTVQIVNAAACSSQEALEMWALEESGLPDTIAGGAIHNGRVGELPWTGPWGFLGFPEPARSETKQITKTTASKHRRKDLEEEEGLTRQVHNHRVDEIL